MSWSGMVEFHSRWGLKLILFRRFFIQCETHAFHGPGATVTIDCPKSLPHCPALSLFGPSSSFQLRLCALVEAVATFWGEMLVIIYLSH